MSRQVKLTGSSLAGLVSSGGGGLQELLLEKGNGGGGQTCVSHGVVIVGQENDQDHDHQQTEAQQE